MSAVNYDSPMMSPGGDPIRQLPVDQSQPTNNELQIVDTLFVKHRDTMDSIFSEAKESLIIGFLFIIFSLPQVDELVKKIFPAAGTSPYILVASKAAIVVATYWLVKHFYLSRA